MRNKRLISTVASAIAVCLSIPALTCSAAYELGDIDGNSVIDGKDATAILSYYAAASAGKNVSLTAEEKNAADVNKDNIVDGIDATNVLSYYAAASVGYTDSLQFYIQNRNTPLDLYPSGLENENDARTFVNGTWTLLPQGEPVQTPAPMLSLKLNGNSAEISISNNGKTGTINSDFSMLNLYDTPRGCYNLIRTVPPTKVVYSIPMTYNTAMDIQFIGANVNGKNIVAMNMASESISPIELILGDYAASNDTWVFEQSSNEVIHKPDITEHAAMRIKDRTFYAYRWLDTGDSVYLQEMNTNAVEITEQNGSKGTALEFSYPLNEHAMIAVQYPHTSKYTKTDCNTYRPGLVKVTTDKNGNITELKELRKTIRGMYQE